MKKYRVKIKRPHIAYAGSMLQQNFGEDETKGFLVWDIKSKNDWEVQFEKLENRYPFITINWEGDVPSTIKKIEEKRKERAFLPGARYRVSSSQSIPSIEERKLKYELKEKHGAAEVVFKCDLISRMEHFTANNLKISKKGLRQDPDAVVKLYLDYILAHASNYNFNKEQLLEAENLIRNYMSTLKFRESENLTSNVNWSLKSFEFDNLFRYGEKNKINFEDLEGIVGVFGPNRIGKSAIIGALTYTLFNTTDRGPMKNAFIINRQKNYGRGRVRLSVGGSDYIIERQSARVIPKRKTKKDHSNKTATTLNFFKVEQGDSSDVELLKENNSISRDETDKKIRKKIGTSNDFLLTALSSQGGVDKFIKEGPTERKNILSRFLELDIFKQLEELVKKDVNVIDARSNYLSEDSLSTQIKQIRKEISVYEREVDILDEKIQKTQMQKDKINLWLMHHEKSAAEIDLSEIDFVENSLIKEKHLLAEKQKEKTKNNKLIEQYKKQIEKNKLAKSKINIEELKKQLDDLEAVRSTLQELKHELSTQENRLSLQKKNVKKLNLVPCGDQYPNCHYIKDAHIDKGKIKKQEKIVNSLNDQIDSYQTKFKNYVSRHIQENIDNWEKLDREEFDLKIKLESSEKTKHYIENEISSLKKKIANDKENLLSMQKRVNILEGKEYRKNKTSLEGTESKLNELNKKRHETLVSLGGKRERLNVSILEQEETKTLIEKLKIYNSIQDAFSKNGIPAMVLKSQLPAINSELNKILINIADFNVTLETDTKSNVMDVFIEDQHSRRIIELASGMEKTIASIALRVALNNLSSLPKPDIFIIDEGFGALDEDNLQSCMEMLSLLRNYFKTILIISHVPQIKEVADQIIEIKHDGEESRVQTTYRT